MSCCIQVHMVHRVLALLLALSVLKFKMLINVLVHSVENNLLNEWLKYEKIMLSFCVSGICEGCCA